MFDLDQFAADCREALRERTAQPAVRDVVARALSQPSEVLKALGQPKQGELIKLFQ
jgi:hypothetical protein